MANHPAPPLTLTAEQRAVLETRSRSRVLPQRQVLRAKVTLLAAEGKANEQSAAELGCSKPTVLQWRERFQRAGLDGLGEACGRGRRPTYAPGLVERVVSTTLGPPPEGMTHWSSRLVARRVGVSFSTVHLAGAPPAAASDPQLRVQHRSAADAEGDGCGGPLPASAGEGAGPLGG